jgi:hypothetical protein
LLYPIGLGCLAAIDLRFMNGERRFILVGSPTSSLTNPHVASILRLI